MNPMAAAAAVSTTAQVVGSIAQYYQSEKARKASNDKLDEIEGLFNAIKPPEYDFSVTDPPKLISGGIPEAAFDLSKLTPNQFALVGKYVPQAAPFIAEKNPQVAQLTASGQAGREAQITALQSLKDRAGKLADLEARQAGDNAMRKAQIGSQSRQQSLMQDYARRGQLGSGTMLAAQLQGNSDQMEQAANVTAAAELAAQKNKLQALKDSGTLGSQLSSQDFSEQDNNADIINRYNQRASVAGQNYENQVAQMQNQAQLTNLNNAQNISNKNVDTQNQYDVMNRKRGDAIVEYKDKRAMQERDYANDNAKYMSKYDQAQKDRLNDLRSNVFRNEMERARGLSGLGQFSINKMYKDAADKNQAIQGGVSTISSAAQGYGNMTPSQTGGTKSDPGADLPALSVQDDGLSDEEKQRRVSAWDTN